MESEESVITDPHEPEFPRRELREKLREIRDFYASQATPYGLLEFAKLTFSTLRWLDGMFHLRFDCQDSKTMGELGFTRTTFLWCVRDGLTVEIKLEIGVEVKVIHRKFDVGFFRLPTHAQRILPLP